MWAKFRDEATRLDAKRLCDEKKLNQVELSFTALVLRHEGLRLTEPLSDGCLREVRTLPGLSEGTCERVVCVLISAGFHQPPSVADDQILIPDIPIQDILRRGPAETCEASRAEGTDIMSVASHRRLKPETLNDHDDDYDDTRREPQSRVLYALAGGVLPAGVAVSGYVRTWAFLDVFGGTFLISEVPLRAMLSPSLAIAGVIALLILFGAVRYTWHDNVIQVLPFPFRGQTAAITVSRVAVVAVAVGGLALAADHLAGARLLVQSRAVLLGLTSVAALILGVATAEFAVIAWHGRARIWEPLAITATLLLFVVFPFLTGREAALESAWNPDRELTRISLEPERGSAYLLFVNHDLLFCVVAKPNSNPGWTKVGPFKSYTPSCSIELTPSPRLLRLSWSAVRQMSGISRYATERDGGLW